MNTLHSTSRGRKDRPEETGSPVTSNRAPGPAVMVLTGTHEAAARPHLSQAPQRSALSAVGAGAWPVSAGGDWDGRLAWVWSESFKQQVAGQGDAPSLHRAEAPWKALPRPSKTGDAATDSEHDLGDVASQPVLRVPHPILPLAAPVRAGLSKVRLPPPRSSCWAPTDLYLCNPSDPHTIMVATRAALARTLHFCGVPSRPSPTVARANRTLLTNLSTRRDS